MTERTLKALSAGIGLLLAIGISAGLIYYFNGSIPKIALLRTQLEQYPTAAPLIFLCAFAAITSIPVPGTRIISMTAGLLFGQQLGFGIVFLGGLLGATISFQGARLFAREKLRVLLETHYGGLFTEFDSNSFVYLLALRINPLFAFAFVHFVMAVSNVTFWRYFIITALVSAPYSYFYAYVGHSLGESAIKAQPFPVGVLVALVAVSLIPVGWRFVSNSINKKNKIQA